MRCAAVSFVLLSLASLASLASLPACSGDDTAGQTAAAPPSPTGSADGGGGATQDAPPDAAPPATCPRVPGPADGPRKVVVSHPFGEGSGKKANAFEVLDLSADGALARPGVTFEMRTAFEPIAFTPDGKIGLVPQDDGTIGVFTFDASGKPVVVDPAFSGSFYAHRIVVAKDGARAFVLDEQTANNGGGVHEIAIGCDGKLSYVGLAVPGGRAHAMALLPGDPDRAVLAGYKAFDSADGTYVHRLDVAGAKVTRLASGGAFGDEDAIASSIALTNDGKYALVTDNGFAKGSRMIPVALATMTPLAEIATPNPAAVVMSPFGNAALLLNSDGEDALRVVSYDAANAAKPFAVASEVAYVGGKTSLPTIASVIDRGTLRGRVLVAETTAVRRLAFTQAGAVEDLGPLSLGEGNGSIVGALGVQP